jgi:hypothetical protein
MTFYRIKRDRIICLNAVRTANLVDDTIFITFTSGDIEREQVVFSTATIAEEVFKKLCTKLERLR